MNRTIRTFIGAILILIIAFSAISICQNIGKRWKMDITDQRLYTLSKGTRAILDKLNQPLRAKLFYAKTAAMKGPDQIRHYNNYYEFVRALLEEYVAASKGMVQLEVIDPRPFSDDEEQAMRYGLRRFQLTEEENFFFGLVVQTQFGVDKVIEFFSPDRQAFIEYDISYLIDTAITREKQKIGVLSSLPVMGQDMSGYMAQMMRMQGQQPDPPWTIVEQLRRQFEVTTVAADVNDINDVDILLVIHPKNLPQQTLFAIDQFVLKGGRTIVCVDPHCMNDRPPRQMQMQMQVQHVAASEMNRLTRQWGVQMSPNTFAGDRTLALSATISRDQRPEPIIGYLNLTPACFNEDSIITTELNQVRVLFAGVLNESTLTEPNATDPNAPPAPATNIERTPLVTTTERGNSWKVDGSYELMFPDATRLMSKFTDGIKPVSMGYMLTGRFKSAFPEGIDVDVEVEDPNDPNETVTVQRHRDGLTEAADDCAVVVFSDVDFISDQMAYADSFFGKMVAGDNAALLLNAIEGLIGSSDLISIRSRGNFKRPFKVVERIEQQAEEETAEEVADINAQIEGFNAELQQIVASAKEGEQEVVGSAIVQKKRELERKIYDARRELRDVKLRKRERTDALKARLRNLNMGAAPAVIMLVAIVLGIRRSARKRHYISHASDS